jgi:hypothetical protein
MRLGRGRTGKRQRTYSLSAMIAVLVITDFAVEERNSDCRDDGVI